MVGVPNNKVMFNFPFPNAGGSPAELNSMFLQGKRINPFKMDFGEIVGAHQIIPLIIE
jgi:hypothetical protein